MRNQSRQIEEINTNSTEEKIIPTTIDEEPELATDLEISNLNFYLLISKFKHGTMFHSILSLFSFSPGIAGFYAPKLFIILGILPTIIAILIIITTSFITSWMLLKLLIHYNVMNIYSLIVKVFSKKVMYIYSFINLLFLLGLSLIHISICNILISNIMLFFGGDKTIFGIFKYAHFVIFIFILFVQLPFAFVRKDSIVNKVHLINGIGILIIGCTLFVFMLIHLDHCQDYKGTGLKPITLDVSFSLGVILCTFFNQNNLLKQTQEMVNLSLKRGRKLISYTYFLQFFSGLIFGFSGLFALYPFDHDFAFYGLNTNGILKDSRVIGIVNIFLLFILENNISYFWIQITDVVKYTLNKTQKLGFFVEILGIVLSNLLVFFLDTIGIQEIILCVIGGICTGVGGYVIPILAFQNTFFGKTMNAFTTEVNYKIYIMLLLIFISLVGAFTSVGGVIFYSLKK